MRYLRNWQLAAVCLLALALLPFVPAPRGTAQAPGYTVTDLGALGTGNVSRAFGLNECGKVVGDSSLAAGSDDDAHPFLWSNGVMIDLGTLGGSTGAATAVNQAGTVVGSAHTPGSVPHAFFWRDLNNNGASDPGEMKDLGSLGGFTVDASDINNLGQVVGQSETTANGNLAERAFVWQDENNNGQSDAGEMKMLTAAWGTPIRAFGINNAGQVVGVADRNVNGVVESHAYVTIGGVAVDLGTLGGTVSFAHKVNDLGEVAGHSHAPGTSFFHAVRWKDLNGNGQRDTNVGGVDEMQDLGTLGTGRNSFAYDLNNGGLVVGKSEFASNSNGTHAFVWSSANGMQDLNTLVPGTNWTFRDAQGINDRGQIVGTGLNPGGKLHAFLLTPTNDPGAPPACSATPTPTPTPGALQFSGVAYGPVTEGNTSAIISVSRTGGDDGAVSVSYATSNGTATADSDYTATNGTLNFADGETTKTFSVTITDDALDEADETVNLTLSNPTGGATLGAQSTATLNITDNDATPTISIADVTVTEGNTGTSPATTAAFAVTLTGASAQTVTVLYSTIDGTATQPGDYTPASGTLTFNPGETGTKNVNVSVVGDMLDEPDETFGLTLSSPTNANFGQTPEDTLGVATITDDDAAPTLSVNDVTVTEGNSGTTNAAFSVTLSAASGKTVTVSYATSDGTATAGSDYTAPGSTALTFAPGETSKPVNVPVLGDTLDEPNETFNVTLSSPTNATFNDDTGVGTITDDDGAPSLTISDAAVTEGNSGEAAATFTVTLSPASGQTVTVNYVSADGTANAGPDYGGTAGTLTFSPGQTTQAITVNAFGDTFNEPNETFFVNLSGASGATIADAQGQGTINNDDAPTLRFSQAAYPAGEGAHFVTVTVTRAGDASQAVGVSFATSDGTASQRRDYTAVSGRLQFAANETSKTFDVLLTVDAYAESEETINLTLSNPTGGAVLGSQSTATVNIADTPPPGPNPIDIASDFVRQHYHDFLSREPDASGLAFWTDQMTNCGSPNLEVCRINVSAAFFQAIEFQQTGYLVYRTYKAAYGDATSVIPAAGGGTETISVPVVRLQEFLPDTRAIGLGVQVGIGDWEQRLEANKQSYMAEFAQRQRFLDAYPLTMTAAQFVDKVNQNAGGVLSQAERDQLAGDLSSGAKTRAQVLRAVAENNALQQAEFRRAFVLMQFYGYLRRNPDDPQDVDFRGWKFWLDKLNQFNGNFIEAEMVKAFLDSIEYRTRFAP